MVSLNHFWIMAVWVLFSTLTSHWAGFWAVTATLFRLDICNHTLDEVQTWHRYSYHGPVVQHHDHSWTLNVNYLVKMDFQFCPGHTSVTLTGRTSNFIGIFLCLVGKCHGQMLVWSLTLNRKIPLKTDFQLFLAQISTTWRWKNI